MAKKKGLNRFGAHAPKKPPFEKPAAFTRARDFSRMIEALMRTLDDLHYVRMRTPTSVEARLTDDRLLTVNITIESVSAGSGRK